MFGLKKLLAKIKSRYWFRCGIAVCQDRNTHFCTYLLDWVCNRHCRCDHHLHG